MPIVVKINADQTPVNQRNSVYVWDDFRSVNGELGWTASNGSSGSISKGTGTDDHPGVNNLATGTTTNSSPNLMLPDFFESNTQSAEFVFQPGSSTSVLYRIGFLVVNITTEAVLVEYDTSKSDTALSLCKYVGSTRTVGATLAINTSHWYRMNWERTGAGAGTLLLTDIDAATNASYAVSGLATGADWSAMFLVSTLNTTNKTLGVDWFKAAMTGMNR